MALQRLKDAAEKAKKDLIWCNIKHKFHYHSSLLDEAGPLHLELTLTRAKFEELSADLS